MSSHEIAGTPESDDLQFETAEYAAPRASRACVACKNEVSGTYYELNGNVICPSCRDAVEGFRTGGSGLARFLRALLMGGAAAFAGFLIYFGVQKIAQLQIGLISILVGFMVGTAVRKGSRHRGGWLFQLLAVFLTYSAIAASYSAVYIPELLATLQKKGAEGPSPEGQGVNKAVPAKPGGVAKPQRVAERPAVVAPKAARLSALELIVALVAAGAFCYALPILVGIQSPIGLLIVGFALWEAWKLNRRVPLVFNGPFEIAKAPADDEMPPRGVPSHV